jgi:putative transcriptional regulator
MSFKYKKLWVLLAVKEMSRTQLRELTGMGTGTLAKLGKDQYVAMEVLDSICNVLDCRIEDIIEHVKQKNK